MFRGPIDVGRRCQASRLQSRSEVIRHVRARDLRRYASQRNGGFSGTLASSLASTVSMFRYTSCSYSGRWSPCQRSRQAARTRTISASHSGRCNSSVTLTRLGNAEKVRSSVQNLSIEAGPMIKIDSPWSFGTSFGIPSAHTQYSFGI